MNVSSDYLDSALLNYLKVHIFNCLINKENIVSKSSHALFMAFIYLFTHKK